MADDHTRDYPYYAQIDALRMLRNSNLSRHTTQICVHLDAPVCASEAGLLLKTDGLSLTLSAAAVSPANAISCSIAWGERHPSVANGIWWRHIKVSSLQIPAFLFYEWFCSQISDADFTGQSVCVCLSVRACAEGQWAPNLRSCASFLICFMCFQSSAAIYFLNLLLCLGSKLTQIHPTIYLFFCNLVFSFIICLFAIFKQVLRVKHGFCQTR